MKKTEHSGPKNGGGFWGTREEAKSLSKKSRREKAKKIVRKDVETDVEAKGSDAQCAFCKIIRGSLPSARVYQDEKCLAFLDIHPINTGHVLVVPRKHFSRMSDLNLVSHRYLSDAVLKVVQVLQESTLQPEGFNIFISDGEVAGQEVPHIHWHIVPRRRSDGVQAIFKNDIDLHKTSTQLEQLAAMIRLDGEKSTRNI